MYESRLNGGVLKGGMEDQFMDSEEQNLEQCIMGHVMNFCRDLGLANFTPTFKKVGVFFKFKILLNT